MGTDHGHLQRLGVELFQMNRPQLHDHNSTLASPRQAMAPASGQELVGSHDSLSMSVGGPASGLGLAMQLSDKFAMCSSMIGYCHYLEAASGAIGFPSSDIEEITRVRKRIEARLTDYSTGAGTICQT